MARHCAKLNRSRRLQALLEALRDGQEHTTRELQEITGGVAVGSTVSELRAHGYEIRCRLMRVAENGSKIFSYKLWGSAA